MAHRVTGGVDALLELIGPPTLRDALRAVRPRGIICQTGLLGNVWVLDDFEPLVDIPCTVRLTTYQSGTTSAERSASALQAVADGVAAGRYRPSVDRVFRFDEIVAAHRAMDDNRVTGKIVIVVASLRRVGGECAGPLSLWPEGTVPLDTPPLHLQRSPPQPPSRRARFGQTPLTAW